MSWLQATPEERAKARSLRERYGDDFYRLAQVLALAVRVESLLLRNVRLRLLPGSDAELETDLWFSSDLMHARGHRAVAMRSGVARALRDALRAESVERYREARDWVREFTRHWPEPDVLEQELRWAVAEGDKERVREGFRRILKTLAETRDPARQRELARWAKGALPGWVGSELPCAEAGWVCQFVAAALGSPGGWLAGGAAEPLPPSLAQALPRVASQSLALRLRPGLLEVLAPDGRLPTIEVTLPLPTPVLITPDVASARWEGVWVGRRIPVPEKARRFTLQSLGGERFELIAEPVEERGAKQDEATIPLNRIRVFFIGYGQSGKTSLVRALNGQTVQAGQEPMTPGIDIHHWPVPDSDIQAHLWDFGGQVMAHATHQFFLRESGVYVLVMESRAEINANQQAQYWLEHVRLFGKNAPVLLVGNKADLTALRLDLNTLKENYPNIVDYFPLSCTGYQADYRAHFDIFRAALVRELKNAGIHQLLFTPRHFGVLEELRNPRRKDQAFLEKQEFERLCERHQVKATGELDRAWLLDILDKLGVVVHFPDIDWLGAYVLNPRWLTYGVYTLLYSPEAKEAQGRITQKQAIAILGRRECRSDDGAVFEFPPAQCRFILDAMQKFKLCYVLPDQPDTYILPDLLPSDKPAELDFEKTRALAFDFDFVALLPHHLMTSFIVRRHGEIHRQLVWQNGVRLRSQSWQADALVQADHHRRRLSLWVTGADAARYFTELHGEFMAILDHIRKEDRSWYQEWVALPNAQLVPGTEPPRADYRDLLALEAAGKTEYACKYGTFKLTEILRITSKEEREKQSRSIHINAGTVIYDENLTDFTLGNNTVIQRSARELDDGLADLLYRIRVDVDAAAIRDKALRELEVIREILEAVQTGDEKKKRSALQTLGRFSDQAKEGSGKTIEALKTLKDGGEAVKWLMDKAPEIISALTHWLG